MVAKDLRPARQLSQLSRPRSQTRLCRKSPPNGHQSVRANISVTSNILTTIGLNHQPRQGCTPLVHPKRVSGEDNVVASTSEVWGLVHLQSDTVAKPMSEVFLPPMGSQTPPERLDQGPS